MQSFEQGYYWIRETNRQYWVPAFYVDEIDRWFKIASTNPMKTEDLFLIGDRLDPPVIKTEDWDEGLGLIRIA